jgi:hypothetical protein
VSAYARTTSVHQPGPIIGSHKSHSVSGPWLSLHGDLPFRPHAPPSSQILAPSSFFISRSA